MASIPKKHTTTTVLFLTAGALAAVLVGASIMAVGGDHMAFASKPFFTAFLFKGDHGNQASSTNTGGNGVGGGSRGDHMAFASKPFFTAFLFKGDHGKQASSTNTGGNGVGGGSRGDHMAFATTTNTGGNGVGGGSRGDHGKQASSTNTGGNGVGGSRGDHGKQAIEQPTKNDQRALCITVGGNSPITGSCTDTATTTTTFTGGIGVVGAGSGDHGKQAIEQPTKNDQKALCITVGGNSPITGSCLQITASTTSNSGGVRASDKLPIG